MCGSFLGNELSQVQHCSKNELDLRSQRGSCKNEGKRWASTKQTLMGQLQSGAQEPQFGVQIPDLPLIELCDFALVTQPLCASVPLSLK